MLEETEYKIIGPLIGPLGEGGGITNARHLLVKNKIDGFIYAAKIINCDLNSPERIKANIEAKIMERMKDISGFIKVLKTDKGLTFITEYTPYGSLREEIHRRNKLLQKHLSRVGKSNKERGKEELQNPFFTEEDVIQLIIRLATILQQLHANKVVHKSVTTEHVLLCDNKCCKIKLCGFGNIVSSVDEKLFQEETQRIFNRSSKILNNNNNNNNNEISNDISSSSSSSLLNRNYQGGLRAYQAKGDVWSLGVIAYELCTLGSRPSSISNIPHPPLPRRYSRRLNYIILSMLSRNVKNRPTRAQVLTLLRRYRRSRLSIHNNNNNNNNNNEYPLTKLPTWASNTRDETTPINSNSFQSDFTATNEFSIHSTKTDALDVCDASRSIFYERQGAPSPSSCRADRDLPLTKLQKVEIPKYEVHALRNMCTIQPLSTLIVDDEGENLKENSVALIDIPQIYTDFDNNNNNNNNNINKNNFMDPKEKNNIDYENIHPTEDDVQIINSEKQISKLSKESTTTLPLFLLRDNDFQLSKLQTLNNIYDKNCEENFKLQKNSNFSYEKDKTNFKKSSPKSNKTSLASKENLKSSNKSSIDLNSVNNASEDAYSSSSSSKTLAEANLLHIDTLKPSESTIIPMKVALSHSNTIIGNEILCTSFSDKKSNSTNNSNFQELNFNSPLKRFSLNSLPSSTAGSVAFSENIPRLKMCRDPLLMLSFSSADKSNICTRNENIIRQPEGNSPSHASTSLGISISSASYSSSIKTSEISSVVSSDKLHSSKVNSNLIRKTNESDNVSSLSAYRVVDHQCCARCPVQ